MPSRPRTPQRRPVRPGFRLSARLLGLVTLFSAVFNAFAGSVLVQFDNDVPTFWGLIGVWSLSTSVSLFSLARMDYILNATPPGSHKPNKFLIIILTAILFLGFSYMFRDMIREAFIMYGILTFVVLVFVAYATLRSLSECFRWVLRRAIVPNSLPPSDWP